MAGGRTRGGESSVTLVARILEVKVPGGEVERRRMGMMVLEFCSFLDASLSLTLFGTVGDRYFFHRHHCGRSTTECFFDVSGQLSGRASR